MAPSHAAVYSMPLLPLLKALINKCTSTYDTSRERRERRECAFLLVGEQVMEGRKKELEGKKGERSRKKETISVVLPVGPRQSAVGACIRLTSDCTGLGTIGPHLIGNNK